MNLLKSAATETDFMKRNQMVWEIMKIHINEGPFFVGSTRQRAASSTWRRPT